MTRWKKGLIVAALPMAILCCAKWLSFERMQSTGSASNIGAGVMDIRMRRAYLLEHVATDAFGPADMPSLVASPYREELAIATLSMTAVALTNVAFSNPDTQIESRDALQRMVHRLLSNEIRRYDLLWWHEDALSSLEGANGHIGYLGHLNLTLGCYFLLGGRDASFRELFDEVSSTLDRRMRARGFFHAESFPGFIYTADNTIAVLSLRVHDMTSTPLYADTIRGWVAFSRTHLLDPESGMLRYHVTASGRAAGTPRGVLQAWNSMWLPLIDEKFAREQYDLLRASLVANSAIGDFAAVREYAAGKTGPTDLVSGPLVLGISPAATGFALGGASLWNDLPLQGRLLRTAEMVGSTLSIGGTRHYLMSPLAGDAAVLAARTMTRWDTRFVNSARRLLRPADEIVDRPGALD